MTKTILLAATAIAAIGFAGAASAQTLTATIGGVTNTGPVSTPYQLANEAVAIVGTPLTSATSGLVLVGTNTAGATAVNTQYLVTFALTGGKYNTGVANGSLSNNGTAGCASGAIQTGGAAGSSTVTFLVTVGNAGACTALPTTFTLTHDLRMEANVAVSGTYTLASSGGVTLDNTPVTRTLVSSVNGFQPFVSATIDNSSEGAGAPDNADCMTVASLGTGATPYTSFQAVACGTNTPAGRDNVLGGAGILVVSNPAAGVSLRPTYINLTGAAGADTTAVATPFILAQVNAVAGVTLQQSTADTTAGAAITGAALTGNRTIFGAATGGITQIAGGAASVSVTPQAISNLTVDGVATGNLESIGLEGTNFIAPWIGGNSATQSVIRVSNNGSQPTGAVTLTILSPVKVINGVQATPNVTRLNCTSAQLSELSSVNSGGELVLTGGDFQACFGTDFTRADIRVTINALAANLTAKMRITSANGSVSEQSLGAISQGVVQ